MSLKTAYIFLSHELGIEPILKLLGIKTVNKVLPSDTKGVLKEVLKSDQKDSILIFFDDEDGIRLLEEFRLKYSVLSPFLILSFSPQDKIVKRLTTSPKTYKPIITFGKGTYFLQLPFRIDKLRDILKEAVPVNKTEMDNIKAEYEFAMRYKEDADFRHRCANLASAIRILQGAYYVGDVRKEDYLSTLESLRQLSWKMPELRAYAKAIKDYIDNFPKIVKSPSLEDDESKSSMSAKIMLLDDEAITAGWDIVLKTTFNKQGYSIASATDREKFLCDIESKGELDFDVLLLDLKMPDSPERGIYLIERMSDRHPYIPIIVFSALTDLPYFRKCQEAGAFNYFAKELGSEDRNPENYYKKIKEILSTAIRFRNSMIKKGKKGYSVGTEGGAYFNTIKTEYSKEWISRFAYRVESVRGIQPESLTQEVARLKDNQNRLLSWLYRQPVDGRSISLRLACFPEEKRIEIILIGKTTGKSAKESLKKANIFSKDMWSWLKMFSPTYRFAPIIRETEFTSLIDTIKPSNLFSIRRQRFVIMPNRKDSFEWFYSFTPNTDSNLLVTIEKMLAMNEPVFIDTIFTPYNYGDAILKKLKECNQIKDASFSSVEVPMNPDEDIREKSPEYLTKDVLSPEDIGKILGNIGMELKSGSEGGFLYRFFIASENHIPVHLIENIRYDYFGDRSNVEIIDETSSGDKTILPLKYISISIPAEKSDTTLQNFINFPQASVLFRLPLPNIDGIRGIDEDRARIIELPRQYRMPTENSNSFFIAEGFRDDKVEEVYMQEKDLDKHLYICGKTGSGKSTLLLRLLLSVIEKGKGVCLIDPHEDLVEMVLERIPESRVNDVIWFNPRDTEKPIGINLLENDGSEEQQDLIVQEFTAMMFKQFSTENMGPMFERSMRYTLLLLMANSLTLSDFAKVWHNEDFRKECLKKLDSSLERHSGIIAFWEKEMQKWKGNDMTNFSTYVISKFDRLNTSKAMKSILGASKSTIDIKEIMDRGKILLISLPRGVIGEVNASLLGMIISTKIRIATLSRASMPAKDRNPFYLFIDEFQNFVSTSGLSYAKGSSDETFASMLSEARKYKVLLILANQYMEQLGEGIRKALFGNIGSLIAFKVGVEDSKYLQEHFGNKLSGEDFRTIHSYHAYANLLMYNELSPPFTIRTIPLEDIPTNIRIKTKIIKQSRERYGVKTQQGTNKSQLPLSSEDWLSKAEKTDDLDEKILFYNKATELSSRDHNLYFERGNIYCKKKDYDHAIIDFTKAIKLKADFVSAYNNRGRAYAGQDEHSIAIDDYTKAIELEPNEFFLYCNRGISYIQKKELDLAIHDLSKAIQMDPNYIRAYKYRAMAYEKKGEHAKAKEDLEKVEKLNSKK